MTVVSKRWPHLLAACVGCSLLLGSFVAAAQPCHQATFSEGSPLPFGPQGGPGRPLGVLDLDGDHRPDLVWVDDAGVRTSRNLGNGEFAPPRTAAAGGDEFVPGDFDADGAPDLVLGRERRLHSLLGDREGGFHEAGLVFEGSFSAPTAGDFDGDGALDLVFVSYSATDNLAVLRGDGRGGFRQPVFGTFVRETSSLVAVDLDHDRRDDLVWWGPQYPQGGLAGVEFSNGDGTFRPGYVVDGGWRMSFRVTPADVDGDGNPDLVVQDRFELGSFKLTVRLLDGSGRIRSTVASPSFHGLVLPNANLPNLAVADFTGDGVLDVAFVSAASLLVAKGDGAGVFGAPVSYPARQGPTIAADVDGDGRIDVVIGPSTSSGPAWFRNTCSLPGVGRTLVVPVIVSSPGAAGSFFESDLTITNSGSTTAHVELTYTPTAGGGGGTVSATIPPRAQLSGETAFGLLERLGIPHSDARSRIGTLRARFDGLASPHAAAISVRTASSGAGVAYPGVEPPSASVQVVRWLKQDARDRSNLGLVNAGASADGEVTLRITVLSTDPSAPGSSGLPELALLPGEFRQIDRILEASGLGASSGVARVERVGGSAPFLAWGVVNDEVSSDGSFVPGEPVGAVSTVPEHVVPSVVETPTYRTEVVLSNPGTVPCPVQLTFYSGDVTGHPYLDPTVDAGSTWRTASLVEELRRVAGSAMPPRGQTVVGSLHTRASDVGCEAVLSVAVRVVSDQGDRGRFGVFVPDVLRAASSGSRVAWIPDLRQDGSIRTNLALVESFGSPASYLVELFSADGRFVAARGLGAPAWGWVQVNAILASWAPGTTRGWARISRVDPSDGPAVAYAILNDGATPGLGTGDGSIVWMEPEP